MGGRDLFSCQCLKYCFLVWKSVKKDSPLAKANVSRLAATIKILQLQTLLPHKKTSNAILPFCPKLLNAICASGCPSGDVTIPITSGPIQNAIVIITPQPVIKAVTREDTIANGTALAAFEASSAIVADDSKPDTTQTGVKKDSINAHPLLVQNPVFSKSANTKLAEFFNSFGVPAAKAMIRANNIQNCTMMYAKLSLFIVLDDTHVMKKVRKVVAANMP